MSKILIIDDDRDWSRSLVIQLELSGHQASSAHDGASGLAASVEYQPDLILLDLRLGSEDGLELLQQLRDSGNHTPVVMVTGEQDMKATIRAGQLGVLDYLRKPFDFEDVLALLAELAEPLAGTSELITVEAVGESPREIVGADRRITDLLQQIGKLAQSRVNVLIVGESGTGKEYVARALHESSTPAAPFVGINCTAMVSNLLESELFGHEKGAFTGAERQKTGRFELAGAGTLFLDEVGDMPLDFQAKLLRVLQEREFERVGGLQAITFKARFVAATQHSLEILVKDGKFREDLYYRLNVAQLELPPLRERKGDMPLLVRHLLWRISRELHKTITGIERAAIQDLEDYDWPGNVRELENVLTRAVALTSEQIIRSSDLQLSLPRTKTAEAGPLLTLKKAEKEHLRHALEACGWNISRTAKLLEITRTTLRKKIHDYNLRERPRLEQK